MMTSISPRISTAYPTSFRNRSNGLSATTTPQTNQPQENPAPKRTPSFGGNLGCGWFGKPSYNYSVTGRTLDKLQNELFPASFFQDDPIEQWDKNELIVDACAGTGQLVRDLQGMEFTNVRGFDNSPKRGPHIENLDLKKLDGSSFQNVSRLFCTWAIFSFGQEKPAMLQESLAKMASWMKPGGKMYIGPVTKSEFEKDFVENGLLSQLGLKLEWGNENTVNASVLLTKQC